MVTGILPAAGAASRFGYLPKYLLPIEERGVTLLDRHVRDLATTCEEIVIGVAPPLHELVSRRFQDDLHVEIKSVSSNSFSETLLELSEFATHDHMILALPDSVASEVNYQSFGLPDEDFPLELGVWKCPEGLVGKVGQLELDQEMELVVAHADKNPLCEYRFLWGVLKFHKSFLSLVNPSEDSLARAIDACLARYGPQKAFLFAGEYMDCGTLKSYFQAIASVNAAEKWGELG